MNIISPQICPAQWQQFVTHDFGKKTKSKCCKSYKKKKKGKYCKNCPKLKKKEKAN